MVVPGTMLGGFAAFDAGAPCAVAAAGSARSSAAIFSTDSIDFTTAFNCTWYSSNCFASSADSTSSVVPSKRVLQLASNSSFLSSNALSFLSIVSSL